MVKERLHQHLFPVLDQMIEVAVSEVEGEGRSVSCRLGCNHCCHLLVEVSWEEAIELASWVLSLPTNEQDYFERKVAENADQARQFFSLNGKAKCFCEPYIGEASIPEQVYDEYFYGSKRPCPFLQNDICAAYEFRPTPCRMHIVTSDPYYCRNDVDNEEGFDYPDRFDELRKDAAPVISALEMDGRWGHLGIMVKSAIDFLKAKEI